MSDYINFQHYVVDVRDLMKKIYKPHICHSATWLDRNKQSTGIQAKYIKNYNVFKWIVSTLMRPFYTTNTHRFQNPWIIPQTRWHLGVDQFQLKHIQRGYSDPVWGRKHMKHTQLESLWIIVYQLAEKIYYPVSRVI